jgi:hypothetical protein
MGARRSVIHSTTDLAFGTDSAAISGDDHRPAERPFTMADAPGYTRRSLMLFVT